MTSRHEKNVARKLRAKERSDEMTRSLRSKPLRAINTRGLQTLRVALGLPVDHSITETLGGEATLGGESLSPVEESSAKRTSMLEGNATILSGSVDDPQRDILDAVFMAIDFERSHYSPKTGRLRLREVGITMLDTRDLHRGEVQFESAITSQHYRTVTDTRNFVFGQSIDISLDDLVTILKRLFHIEQHLPRKFEILSWLVMGLLLKSRL